MSMQTTFESNPNTSTQRFYSRDRKTTGYMLIICATLFLSGCIVMGIKNFYNGEDTTEPFNVTSNVKKPSTVSIEEIPEYIPAKPEHLHSALKDVEKIVCKISGDLKSSENLIYLNAQTFQKIKKTLVAKKENLNETAAFQVNFSIEKDLVFQIIHKFDAIVFACCKALKLESESQISMFILEMLPTISRDLNPKIANEQENVTINMLADAVFGLKWKIPSTKDAANHFHAFIPVIEIIREVCIHMGERIRRQEEELTNGRMVEAVVNELTAWTSLREVAFIGRPGMGIRPVIGEVSRPKETLHPVSWMSLQMKNVDCDTAMFIFTMIRFTYLGTLTVSNHCLEGFSFFDGLMLGTLNTLVLDVIILPRIYIDEYTENHTRCYILSLPGIVAILSRAIKLPEETLELDIGLVNKQLGFEFNPKLKFLKVINTRMDISLTYIIQNHLLAYIERAPKLQLITFCFRLVDRLYLWDVAQGLADLVIPRNCPKICLILNCNHQEYLVRTKIRQAMSWSGFDLAESKMNGEGLRYSKLFFGAGPLLGRIKLRAWGPAQPEDPSWASEIGTWALSGMKNALDVRNFPYTPSQLVKMVWVQELSEWCRMLRDDISTELIAPVVKFGKLVGRILIGQYRPDEARAW
ncbi:hypothetical protein NEDG_01786 [Nematocida displodere]|uniref:Uncharacterized protein n=1 Tax=Nematocida displodere TaxID=1805483 RepID=A0A177EHF6_9MICR|nr:hypothetical protein NEDG_01786 [Nematocida displodere]